MPCVQNVLNEQRLTEIIFGVNERLTLYAITCSVYFLDMLDYLDYMTFDSGPGQIMLKARAFYTAMSMNVVPVPLTIGEKVDKLISLLEDGERRLAENRKRSLEQYRRRAAEYKLATGHLVTEETQSGLNLQ
jgi:hypothetical protein